MNEIIKSLQNKLSTIEKTLSDLNSKLSENKCIYNEIKELYLHNIVESQSQIKEIEEYLIERVNFCCVEVKKNEEIKYQAKYLKALEEASVLRQKNDELMIKNSFYKKEMERLCNTNKL